MTLTAEQIQSFHTSGYLILPGCISHDSLQPIIDEYSTYIDRRSHDLYFRGLLRSTYSDSSFECRLADICKENGEIYRELDAPMMCPRSLFNFMHEPTLLSNVKSLIGPNISCSPILHVRAKLPVLLTPVGEDPHVVPWHQDSAVAWEEADPYDIITVWIPLVDVHPESGCMQIIPGVHTRGLMRHVTRHGTRIFKSDFPIHAKIKSIIINKGDILLMHRHTPHRSLRNMTDRVRWSMDIRFQATGGETGRPYAPSVVVEGEGDRSTYEEWKSAWQRAVKYESEMKLRRHRWPCNYTE